MFQSVHLLTDECVLIYWGKLYNIKHTYQVNFIALIFFKIFINKNHYFSKFHWIIVSIYARKLL